MTSPIHKTGLSDEALDTLPGQFGSSGNLRKLIAAIVGGSGAGQWGVDEWGVMVWGNAAGGLQEVEDVLWYLQANRWLDEARDDVLDKIGEHVGLARTSADDNEYRKELYLQIAINTSQGTAERLISITKYLSEGSMVEYRQKQPAVALLYNHEIADWSRIGKVQRAATGGVRVVQTGSPDADVFVFGVDRDSSGDGHGEELSYGSGFAEAAAF